MACCLTLSSTPIIVAVSGILLVLKERMLRPCCFAALSPNLKIVLALLNKPPMLLVSLDSSTRPSCAPIELSVTTTGVAVLVGVLVTVLVTVLVGVLVIVFVAVLVDVLVTVFVSVLDGVRVKVAVFVGV